MKLTRATKRKKQAAHTVSTELLLTFGYIAGKIVDTQIDWKPGQTGRWDVAYLPDGKTPRIEFSLFPEGTILTLRSLNHSEADLGLEAAALAISECAMNWVSHQAYEARMPHIGETAALLYHRLHNYIWYNPESGLTEQEKILIQRYND
ncbi:MAG TPA: hypothetical protein VGS27_35045 [Candidatus Sulfotelmatobacter sp.]|nr:hypothetical protein [Candidatus Sulfotelmatobacter sp.]